MIMEEKRDEKRKMIGRTDILIFVSIIVLSVAALVLFGFILEDKGDTVVITVNGEEYATLPLDENAMLEVETERGYNLIVVEDGRVYVREADCSDKICVKSGEATELKTVVCLPHRVTVGVECKD